MFLLLIITVLQLEFAKFGPWGGGEGTPQDIKVLPYRLDRIAISSGPIIDSIEFSYTDQDGQDHTAGPWGGHGGDNNSVRMNRITLFLNKYE